MIYFIRSDDYESYSKIINDIKNAKDDIKSLKKQGIEIGR